MRMKLDARCKSSRSNHIWFDVLDRFSRLLARPKDTETNDYDDIRFVLPFYLP